MLGTSTESLTVPSSATEVMVRLANPANSEIVVRTDIFNAANSVGLYAYSSLTTPGTKYASYNSSTRVISNTTTCKLVVYYR